MTKYNIRIFNIFLLAIILWSAFLSGTDNIVWAFNGELAYRNSVVKIYTTTQRPDTSMPWQSNLVHKSTGTGFLIDNERIMTNAHVVSDARYIEIQRDSDPERYLAEVIFIAHDCDLALLSVKEKRFYKDIRPVRFAKSMPQLNDEVIVLGYPMGGIRISLTKGVVSRIDYSKYTHSGADTHLVMQVDAAINPGNSGGPVIFKDKVVGLAFQILSRSQNIGYAIPLPVINRFLEDVSDGTYHGFPELGIEHMPTYNKALRKDLKLSAEQTGVVISVMDPFGSAYTLLSPGDVLLEIDNHNISNDGSINLNGNNIEFYELMERKQWGQEIKTVIWRDGKELKLTIPLTNPFDPFAFRQKYDKKPEYFILGGLVFSPLTRDYLRTLGKHIGRNSNQQLLYYSQFVKIDGQYKDREQFVVLSRRLAHPVNTYSDGFLNCVVSEVNGKAIRHIRDLEEAIKTPIRGFHIVKFEGKQNYLVLNAKAVAETTEELLSNYLVDSPKHFEGQP